MSAFDSAFPNREYNTLSKKHPAGLLSLNDILKESLKKAQAQAENVQLIVRCELLPLIKAGQEDMTRLFDYLLSTILNHAGNSRLFLHVDCDKDSDELMDLTLEKGFQRYIIKFYTNITTHDNWKLINNQALINCGQILSRHNGFFFVNDIRSTGCLFSISLPGKLNRDASK